MLLIKCIVLASIYLQVTAQDTGCGETNLIGDHGEIWYLKRVVDDDENDHNQEKQPELCTWTLTPADSRKTVLLLKVAIAMSIRDIITPDGVKIDIEETNVLKKTELYYVHGPGKECKLTETLARWYTCNEQPFRITSKATGSTRFYFIYEFMTCDLNGQHSKNVTSVVIPETKLKPAVTSPSTITLATLLTILVIVIVILSIQLKRASERSSIATAKEDTGTATNADAAYGALAHVQLQPTYDRLARETAATPDPRVYDAINSTDGRMPTPSRNQLSSASCEIHASTEVLVDNVLYTMDQ